MILPSAKESGQIEKTVTEWNKLSEDERKQLIPVLLHSIIEWRIWSVTSMNGIHWLENQFRDAGVPFR